MWPSHAQWAEVRLADFYAPELHDAGDPEAKDALSHLVKGKQVECVADHRNYDRVMAVCRLRGRASGGTDAVGWSRSGWARKL